jgi:hypothetical protein
VARMSVALASGLVLAIALSIGGIHIGFDRCWVQVFPSSPFVWWGLDFEFGRTYRGSVPEEQEFLKAEWKAAKQLPLSDSFWANSHADYILHKFEVPHLVTLACLGTVPLICRQEDKLRRKRALAGRCVQCGYDLRASPDRCPECGQAIHRQP